MKARYVIEHHPGLFTELRLEYEDNRPPTRVPTPDWTWAETREYCRQSMRERGIEPEIQTDPARMRYVEFFPWVEI